MYETLIGSIISKPGLEGKITNNEHFHVRNMKIGSWVEAGQRWKGRGM